MIAVEPAATGGVNVRIVFRWYELNSGRRVQIEWLQSVLRLYNVRLKLFQRWSADRQERFLSGQYGRGFKVS